MILLSAIIASALAADVGERERLARVDVDVWVVRTDRAAGEPLEALAACPNADARTIPAGSVLPISVRGSVLAFCVQVRSKVTVDSGQSGGAWSSVAESTAQPPFPDLVADLEVRDSGGRWRLIHTIQMEEFSWTSRNGAPEAIAAVPVDYAKMEAVNLMASTEIGSAAFPCKGTLRLVVRRRGSNFDEVDGQYGLEPRRYRSSLSRCPKDAGPRNPDPAETLEGG